MKKLIALLLCTILILGLVACGSGKNDTAKEDAAKDDAATEAPATTDTNEDDTSAGETMTAVKTVGEPRQASKEWNIAVVAKDLSGEWFKRMEKGVLQFADEHGVMAYEAGPASYDAALQLQVVENLIAQGVDAICIVPIDPATVEPALKRAMDAGIIVITHESPDVENSYYNVECGPLEDYAYRIMDVLAEGMNYEGTWVGVVGSLTVPTHMTWVDMAAERAAAEYPNLIHSDVDRIESKDTKETAYEACTELLKAHPDITGILCVSDMDSLGAAQAVKELGLEGKVAIAGGGIPSTHREAIKNGEVLCCGLWDPAESGYAMCALALQMLEDGVDSVESPFNAGVTGYDSMVLEDKTFYAQGTKVWTIDTIDDDDACF